jgi:DNA-binding NtrC family response regulator
MNKDEKPVILLITNDISTKLFLKNHLENKYHIIEKKTFDDIIQTAETTNLDLVIVDDRLENALEIVFQLKKRKRLFIIPIILITARLKKAYKQKAIKAGAFDFLYIPLKKEEIDFLLQKCEEEKKRIKKISSISSKLKNNQ